MNIDEGSKILAKFEGAKLISVPASNKNGSETLYYSWEWPNGRKLSSWREMQYHTSFDWLIPVWVKFNNLSEAEKFPLLVRGRYHDERAKIQAQLYYGNAESLFESLVDAVKLYNEYKKQEKLRK